MYDYHDATLKGLTLDWENGTTTLTLALCTKPAREVAVRMRETTDVECGRHFPWGKSVSVSRLDLQEHHSGWRLDLEMQSGDKLVVFGKEISESLVELDAPR